MRVYIYALRYVPNGGAYRILDIYIRALKARGHTPVLTTFMSTNNNYAKQPCDMREENFKGGFISLQHHCASLMRADEESADVFFVYGAALMWGGGMYVSRGGKVPVAASIYNFTDGMGLHRALPFAGGITSRLSSYLRRLIHRAKHYVWEKTVGIRYATTIDLAFFDSPVVLEQYRRFGYCFRTTAVIPAPVEKNEVLTGLPSPYPTDPQLFHVLFAGRLVADKGADLLVKAAAFLPDRVHVHIVGSGDEEPALRALIQNSGLTERVHLYGWKTREELAAFYRYAHVFAHPIRWPEPFGLTASMALSAGLPVITVEGIDAAGDAGLRFKTEDPASLAKCVLFFFNNPKERAVYSKKAVARSHIFDADAASRQFVSNLGSLSQS